MSVLETFLSDQGSRARVIGTLPAFTQDLFKIATRNPSALISPSSVLICPETLKVSLKPGLKETTNNSSDTVVRIVALVLSISLNKDFDERDEWLDSAVEDHPVCPGLSRYSAAVLLYQILKGRAVPDLNECAKFWNDWLEQGQGTAPARFISPRQLDALPELLRNRNNHLNLSKQKL